MKKFGLIAILLLVLSLLLAACGDSPTAVTTTTAATSPVPNNTVPINATSTPVVANGSPTKAATQVPAGTTAASNATTSAATGTPIPVPTVAVSAEAQQTMDKIGQDASKVRGLNFKDKITTNFMTRDDLGKYNLATFKRDNPPEEIAKYEKIFEAFGFTQPGFSLLDTYVKLYTEQVLGFYDPDTKKFYIVTEDPSKGASPLAKFTAEHELTHALQDQNYDLNKLRPIRKPTDKEGNDDRDLAITALIEGDAVQSQNLWLTQRFLSSSELNELIKETQNYSSDSLNQAPAILRDSLEFPYNEGLAFVTNLYKQGGWPGVNKAWKEYPPVSTSQILNFDKYQKKIEPVKVDLSDLTGTLGDGWKSLDINTMGEFQTRIWLKGQLTVDQATKGASGWAGDRYQVLDKDGKAGFVWRTSWDSETEAKEFFDFANQYVVPTYKLQGNGGGGDKRVWQSADKDVQLIRKGQEVLVLAMPKGDAAVKIVGKLGFQF